MSIAPAARPDPQANPLPVTFHASCALMEDYRYATEITPATDLVQVVNARGESEIFYSAIDANQAPVFYNVHPDGGSDTGWSVDAVPVDSSDPPGPQALFAGGAGGDGTLTFFYVGQDQANPDIQYATRSAAGTWSTWSIADTTSADPEQPTAGSCVVAMTAAVVNGSLELAAVLSNAGAGSMGIWLADWDGTKGGWKPLGSVVAPALDFCTTAAGTGVLGQTANGAAYDLVFFPFSGPPVTLASGQNFNLFDSALQASGHSGVFLYNNGYTGGTPGISFLDCGLAAPVVTQIDTTLSCQQLVAVNAGSNPILLAVRAGDGHVNVLSVDPGTGTWLPAFDLEVVLGPMTAGLNADGAPLMFGIDATGTALTSLLQQPWSVDGEWTQQDVEVQQFPAQTRQLQMVPVYGTVFTLMDAAGNLLANTTVTVGAVETTTFTSRALSFAVGPGASVTLTTDGTGALTLYAETGTINANKLLFSVPALGMNPGDAIVVDADDPVRAQLKNLSVDQTRRILAPNYQDDDSFVTALYTAVTQAMSYDAIPGAAPAKNARFVAAANVLPGYHRAIDPASVRVPNWSFSIQDGRATYAELTPEAFAALRASLGATGYGASMEWPTLADIGNWAKAFVDGLVGTVTVAVQQVEDVVQAVIHIVIGAKQYLFDQPLTVERAFQVVEMLFAAAKVKFNELFDDLGWLLSTVGTEIWDAKNALEAALTQAFPQMEALCATGKSATDAFIASAKTTVQAQFASAIASARQLAATFDYDAPDFAGTGIGGGAPASSPGAQAAVFQDSAVTANWFFEKIVSPLGPSAFAGPATSGMGSALANFEQAVSNALTTGITDEIAAVRAFLGSITSTPAQFMASTVVLVLQTVENLVLLVIDVMGALLDAVFDLLSAVLKQAQLTLQQPVGGDFAAELYNLISPTPEPLTMAGLIALIAAFPVAVLGRVLTGGPLFTAGTGLGAAETVKDAAKLAGGILQCFWVFPDLALDLPAPAKGPPPVLAIAAFLPVLIHFLGRPGTGNDMLLPGTTGLDVATNVAWAAKLPSLLYATGYKVGTAFQSGPRGNQTSCAILSILGVGFLGASIAKGVVQSVDGVATTQTWFVNIAGPLAIVGKPLRFAGEPACAGILILDGCADVGGGVITCFDNT